MSNTKHLTDLFKVCSVLPALLIMPAIGATHPDPIQLEKDTTKTISTGKEEIYTGALSGDGTFFVRPNCTEDGCTSTTAIIEGSIENFTGEFKTTYSGSDVKGSGILVLKNWAPGQKINLVGSEWTDGKGNHVENMGTVEFAGHNKLELNATNKQPVVAYGNIYLMDNELDTESVIEGFHLYLGTRGGIDNGRDVELSGYYGTKNATLYISGSNNSVNGDLRAEIENSSFRKIAGMANNVTMNGNIVLDIENINNEKLIIIGQQGGDSGNNETKSMLTGDIHISVEDSHIDQIVGQQFNAYGSTESGINGNIYINMENSVAKQIRGVNFNAGDYENWNRTYYNIAENINITVKDSVITEELLGTGSYSSAGNVKIDVLGNTVIGYTDETASEVTDGADGWIIAGAQKPGAHVDSAEINLNTAGTIKVAGDVNAGSGEKISANADEDSTGIATLNMFGGGNIFVGGDVRAYHVAGDAVFNLNNISVEIAKTLKEFTEINVGDTASLTVNNVEFTNGSALNMSLKDINNYAKLAITGTATGADNANLNLLIASAGQYNNVLSGITFDDFADVSYSTKVFDITLNGGNVTATVKSTNQIASENNISTETAGALTALVTSPNAKLQQLSLKVQEVLATENSAIVEKELAKVKTNDKPMTQSVAASVQGQVLTVASGRMSSVGGGATGRAGGDVTSAGVWAQGLVNKSKLNGQFDGHTRGFALGADTLIDDVYTIGAGYAYSNTDIDTKNGDTSVESNSVFAYAQYKPANWYINATMNYTMSEYTDETNVLGITLDNKYDADAFGIQAMYGYDFASGVTPEFGMRYLHVSQDAHQDALGRPIAEMNTNFLSVVSGVNYAFDIKSDTEIKFSPSLRAAMTYDVISENAIATVMVPGSSAYFVDVENLSRLGGEFGIGLTAEWRGLEMSLNYELDLHEDYTSQTGLLKFRYDF